MIRVANHIVANIVLCLVVVLLIYDSASHFNREIIQLKRNNNSAQNNWNLFYGQRFVFYDSSFRYTDDFRNIEKQVEPGYTVLSDLATSYYAAVYLPLYARNVNSHQGRRQSPLWARMLDERMYCNLHTEESFNKFKHFIRSDIRLSHRRNEPSLRYVLVNKDNNNKNVRLDCLTNRRELFMTNITRLTELKYEGQYINLYEIRNYLPSATLESH